MEQTSFLFQQASKVIYSINIFVLFQVQSYYIYYFIFFYCEHTYGSIQL